MFALALSSKVSYFSCYRHNIMEGAKYISCAKNKGTVDHDNQMVQEILLKLKNPDNQPRSSRPKTMVSEALLQAIEANLISNFQRLSSKFGISQFNVAHYLQDFRKKHLEKPNCATYYQNIAKLLTRRDSLLIFLCKLY